MASIEIVSATGKPDLRELVCRQLARLVDWLNEEVGGEAAAGQLTVRDWADLPVHHPSAIRDGKGAR